MKHILFFIVVLFATEASMAQHCIQFRESDHSRQALISRTVSIDRLDGDLYTAYANNAELQAFVTLGYEYSLVEPQSPKAISMASTFEQMARWDRYPTYDLYLSMMQRYAEQFPTLCKIDTIGTSVGGRLLLCAKISDNATNDEAEPQFFYSSSMHGDEITGYYFMLRLIDTLLNSYGTDASLTQLVNSTQIFINPLANPDGTYYRGNNTVQGSIRYNANFVDLNRNYPDPFGTAPLNSVQPENIAMIDYIAAHRFVLSANLHGGSEVMNYPWDSYTSHQRTHADIDWWKAVAKRYVDTCRMVSNNRYRDVNSAGYINGGDWYVISNGRQDYVNYYAHCREMTMEVSTTKTLSSTQLCSYWNAQSHSLINYIKEVHHGVHGMVTDSTTGEPLCAMIEVVGHDYDNSQVFSSALWGDFYRMLPEGSYTLRISAQNYTTKEVAVEVTSDGPAVLSVELSNGSIQVPEMEMIDVYKIYPNPTKGTVYLQTPQGIVTFDLSNYPSGVHLIGHQGHYFKVVKQ